MTDTEEAKISSNCYEELVSADTSTALPIANLVAIAVHKFAKWMYAFLMHTMCTCDRLTVLVAT